MRRKIGILALCMVIGLSEPISLLAASHAALPAYATDHASSGTWGDVSWTVDEAGTLTISGTGRMGEERNIYSSDDSPWAHRSDIKHVIIEDGVTNIDTWAFYGCDGITSMIIADSVATIDFGAFSGCRALTTVKLPKGLTRIDYGLFYDCQELTSVTLPEELTYIGESAFEGCSSLSELIFPESVTFVGANAFKDTAWLTAHPMAVINHILVDGSACRGDAVIPSDVTSIAGSAFAGCTGLTSLSIPEQVANIGDSAFSGCTGLTEIRLPSGLTEISSHMFEGCTGLTSFTIPDKVKRIGFNAFHGCTRLTEIVIPDSVTDIGSDAFSGCTSLASVTLPESNITIGKGAFSDTPWQADNLFFILQGSLTDGSAAAGDVVIPDTVNRIASWAFAGNTDLTSVEIPVSVSRIEDYAFNACTGLQSVTIHNPYCRIKDAENTFPEETVIYGYADSIAQYYAEKYDRTFIALDDSEKTGYTYEIIPLLEPFNEFFYVRTENPDPYSFRFVDKETVYGEEGSLMLEEVLYPDVRYENAETFRVSGGYIFRGSGTDGGALTLQADTQTDAPYQIPCTNLSTGEVTMETVRNEIWVDLGNAVTLPKLYDDVDYLIEQYAAGSDFFAKMDAVQKGFSSICLYSSSYVRGEVERKGKYWALSNSPHVDQAFYIQSPYTRSGNRSLFAGVLYPLRYDSVGFPSVMGSVAKRLDASAEFAFQSDSHAYIDVTYGDQTKTYGGQGSGKGQGINSDQILQYYTFEEADPSTTISDTSSLLSAYAGLEVTDDVPKEDTLTWDDVCDSVGSGAWVRLIGISSIFGGYSDSYSYLYDTGGERWFYANDSGVGGSIYWRGSMGYASDTWVDGRYINSNEIWVPGEKFSEHPQSDIILTQIPFPEIRYDENYSTGTFENIVVKETIRNVRFQYDAKENLWKPASAVMSSFTYADLVSMVKNGQIDRKYLDMVQITSDEIETLCIDRNTDEEPEMGYIYDGSRVAGSVFDVNDPPYPTGDVNEDDTVNASDAAEVLIAAARIGAGETKAVLSREQQTLADVNLDGTVNASDAAVILQYAAAVGASSFSGTIEEFQHKASSV
ncbi:MAG: leucine-rich repeat protein [Oscillospiraceae bacterium]|nr:leucine-rich repeat protein [Oscillospiraceae bacterium]